ncbi:hypothetical protein [Thiothrix sp.]|jgi:mannose/fructose/N-acetylgalactosamine-specific phosphotransferase system component IIC|uniref:hypothetical protein n=1 Tax=Thiothrix sp. TaxID=1032 RepID=UPI00257FB804|nr:hypothetical protein [Thiothrix sp.]
MSTANKLSIIGIIVAIIGIAISVKYSEKSENKQTIQTTNGDKSPNINSNGDISIKIQ